MKIIFKKFGREGKNPGGVVSTPLGRPKVDFYLGHLRVNIADYFRYRKTTCKAITGLISENDIPTY